MIGMHIQKDDFGLIRVQFFEKDGAYRSAVWLTPIDAARLVGGLAPILRDQAAKMGADLSVAPKQGPKVTANGVILDLAGEGVGTC